MSNFKYKIVNRDDITRVYDPDGIELKNVIEVVWEHTAGDTPTAHIVVYGELDAESEFIQVDSNNG